MMIITSNRFMRSDRKCPKCGSNSLYNARLDLYACAKPIVLADDSKGGSCGKFYSNGEMVKR